MPSSAHSHRNRSALRKIPLFYLWVVPFGLQTLAAIGIAGYLSYRNYQKDIETVAHQVLVDTGDLVDQNLKIYLALTQALSNEMAPTSHKTISPETGIFIFNQFLKSLNVGETGQVYLLNRQGYLVAASTNEIEFNAGGKGQLVEPWQPSVADLLVQNSQNSLTRGSATALLQQVHSLQRIQQPSNFKLQFGQDRYFMRVQPLSLGDRPQSVSHRFDWLIVVVLPESDLHRQPASHLSTLLLVCGGMLTLAALKTLWTAHWVTQAVNQLNRAAAQISQGDFSAAQVDSPVRELAALGQAFQTMEQRLQSSFQATSENEHRLQQSLDALPVGVIIYQPDGQAVYVNPVGRSLFGAEDLAQLAPTALIRTGQIRSYTTGLPYPIADFPIVRALNGESATSEDLVLHCSEPLQYLEMRAVPICNRESTLTSVLVVVQDITTRCQTERLMQDYNRELTTQVAEQTTALKRSEARLRAMLEAIPDLIVLIGKDDTFLEKIKSIELQDGFSIDQPAIGQPITEIMPASVAALELAAIQQVQATGQVYVYKQQLQIGDRQHYEEVRAVPYQDDAVLFMVRNITARKLAELELKQTLQKLTSHIENSPLATILWDHKMRVQYWSEQAERMFGWPASEVVGQTVEELGLVYEADKAVVEQAIQKLLMGVPRLICANRNYRKDGSVIDCEWFNSVLVDEQGCLASIMSQVQDVSDRKRTETQLRLSQERLAEAQRVAQIGSWEVNMITHSVNWSEEMYRIFGYDSSLPPPPLMAFLEQLPPSDRHAFQQAFDEAAQTLQPTRVEYRFKHRDQSNRYVETWITAEGDAQRRTRFLGTALDITARKQAEAALQRSEARLQNLAANMPSSVIYRYVQRQDGSDAFTYVSPSCRELWELAPEAVMQDTAPLWALLHPEDRKPLKAAIEQSQQNLTTWRSEHRLIMPSGKIKWCQGIARPERLPNGDTAWDGVLLDISDRKQAEAKLRQQEQQLRLLTNALPVFISYADTEQRYRFVNRTYETHFGQPADWFIGKHLREVIGEQGYEQVKGYVQRVLQGEQVQYELLMPSERQPERYLSVVLVPDMSEPGLVRGYYSLITDITQQKLTENALRQNKIRLENLARAIPGHLYTLVLTPQGDLSFEYSNMAAEDILEVPLQELLDNPQLTIDLIHPEDRADYLVAAEQSALTLSQFCHEWRIITPTGKVKWVQASSQPEQRENGSICWHGILQDVSDRKAIERIKSEFISIVSHELRTPLTGIRGALGLAASGVYDSKPDRTQRMIRIALEDTDRLVRLVNNMLDLERLEAGKAHLKLEVCAVDGLMQRAIDVMQSAADAADIQIVLQPSHMIALAAPDAIVQTLTNLVSNAIKFSPAKSQIYLGADRIPGAVIPTPALQEGCNFSCCRETVIRIAIRDQGRGIPVEQLETIFERFQQVDVSDSRKKGGTGLGLAICRNIIRQHGGKIWVESQLGLGSVFYFTLPAMTEDL